MPGVLELYVTHANDYVNGHVAANTAFNISRAKLELTIMRELDKSTFPTEYKLAWFSAILTSDLSTSFWLSVQMQHSLPPSCIARYVPDPALLSIEAPHSSTHEGPSTPPNYSPSIESSPTPASRPDKAKLTHHERSSSGVASNGDTKPNHTTTEPEEVWHGEDRPEVVKQEETTAPKRHKFTTARMSTGGKKPRIPTINGKPIVQPKANAHPRTAGEKAKPKPKRKRASGGGASQASKRKKVVGKKQA